MKHALGTGRQITLNSFREYWAATPSEIRSLVTKAKDISAEAFQAFHGLTDFRNYAFEQFLKVVTEEQFDIEEIGFVDVALVIDGASERKWQNDGTFLSTLKTAYPNLLGAQFCK